MNIVKVNKPAFRVFVLLLLSVLFLVGSGCGAKPPSKDLRQDESEVRNNSQTNINTKESKQRKATDNYNISNKKKLRFRNKRLLEEHYQKHGIDMGFKSTGEYEEAASAAALNPNALHKKEKEDGDDVYYLEETNEFVIVSTDGYIRTYFKPDSGKRYFNKQ